MFEPLFGSPAVNSIATWFPNATIYWYFFQWQFCGRRRAYNLGVMNERYQLSHSWVWLIASTWSTGQPCGFLHQNQKQPHQSGCGTSMSQPHFLNNHTRAAWRIFPCHWQDLQNLYVCRPRCDDTVATDHVNSAYLQDHPSVTKFCFAAATLDGKWCSKHIAVKFISPN